MKLKLWVCVQRDGYRSLIIAAKKPSFNKRFRCFEAPDAKGGREQEIQDNFGYVEDVHRSVLEGRCPTCHRPKAIPRLIKHPLLDALFPMVKRGQCVELEWPAALKVKA